MLLATTRLIAAPLVFGLVIDEEEEGKELEEVVEEEEVEEEEAAAEAKVAVAAVELDGTVI